MSAPAGDGVRAAAAAAADFLLASRDAGGTWTDFHLYPGTSDEWVTAYVALALAEHGGERGREAACSAWGVMEGRQRADGRWGYSAITLGDGDSTCWGIRLARAAGADASPRIARAAVALAEHERPGGGFATYHTDGPIRAVIEAPPELSFRGWCGAHDCVTAAVAGVAEAADDACRHLRAAQRADGSWPSYWWSEPEYATALAAEALARAAAPGDAERAARAAAWARGRLHPAGFVPTDDLPAGSPFATALCLRALLAGGGAEAEDAVLAAASWLWFSQRADGAWRASARLRVPWPDDDHPESSGGWVRGGRKEGALIVDQNALFTTATVLDALGRLIAAAQPAVRHAEALS